MLPDTTVRSPQCAAAESSRKIGHGSSSLQPRPAQRMSSPVQRNGSRMGLPWFSNKGGAGAGCSAAGSCARDTSPKANGSAKIRAANRVTSPIVAQARRSSSNSRHGRGLVCRFNSSKGLWRGDSFGRAEFSAATCNPAAGLSRPKGKSPLRLRAHYTLSPRCARFLLSARAGDRTNHSLQAFQKPGQQVIERRNRGNLDPLAGAVDVDDVRAE